MDKSIIFFLQNAASIKQCLQYIHVPKQSFSLLKLKETSKERKRYKYKGFIKSVTRRFF